jgi:rhodanese-related sulfurtransferase
MQDDGMSSRRIYSHLLAGVAACAALIVLHAARAEDTPRLKTIDELVQEAHAGVKFIDIDALRRRIASRRGFVLLDVRTQKEFDAGHIKGAAWVERGVAEFVLARQLPDPDAEIVVYCKVGNRTGLVVKALSQAGYRNVVGLEGGFDEWARQGHAVHNYLGEFKLIAPTPRNAASSKVDFYQDKR